ncbi:SGNH/GDSL hydrolase family protein [bacterium]|nr:SGNH/GDSL hydrolase family protein [candidate division CSSED10-310 bacterium]
MRLWHILKPGSMMIGWIAWVSSLSLAAGSAPRQIHPPDGDRYVPGDPIVWIEFEEIADAVKYEILLSFTPDMQYGFVFESLETILDFADFLSQEEWDELSIQLYWQVRAQVDEWTDWSDVWVFAKSVTPAADLLTPGKDARFGIGDPMPVLTWSSLETAVCYAIEFAEDIEFETSYGWFRIPGTVLDFSTGDPEAWNAIVNTFFWRVWGLEVNDVPGPHSESFYFSKTTLDKPSPTSPANHTRLPSESVVPVLNWEPVDGAVEYHVQLIYGDAVFPDGLEYFTFSDTHFDFSEYGITQQIWNDFYGQLKWRVAAVGDDGHHGSFSIPFEFSKIANYRYMAYGDSITGGYGSDTWGSGFAGYPPILQRTLRSRYGDRINVVCEAERSWFPGGHAYTGDWEMEQALKYHGPSVTLILFGTVDAIDPGAPGCDNFDCHVKEHLYNMIQQSRAFYAEPLIATLPPVNPESERAYVQGDIDLLNLDIRDLAQETGVVLADLESAFYNAPLQLPEYFYNGDWAHFNEMGYLLMAETWAELL